MTTYPKHDDVLAALTARKNWENRQSTWYQMRHDGLRRRNKPWPNASDMHYPLADGIIEKLKPTFISQIFATDTVATFTALKQEFSSYQTAAAQWFDYQLKQESNFEEQMDIAIDTELQTGKCPVKLFWDAENTRLHFEAINPLDIIVPPWTEALSQADWLVHVQRYSVAAYKRLKGFRTDDGTIEAIRGNGNAAGTDNALMDTARMVREGITRGQNDDQIVIWELYWRKDDGSNWVRTYSPTAPTLDLRDQFGLPYNKGPFEDATKPFPFGEFNLEVKDRGYYSPRGICERVAAFEASMCKDWNTIKDYQTLTCNPVFYAESGVPGNTNLRMIPGQILPFKLAAVQFPQIPVDLSMQMQGTQRAAEELTSVPSVGVGRQVDPTKNKTAAETNLIASIMQSTGDVRARVFRRQLGQILNFAWGLLVQYRTEDASYFFNDQLLTADKQLFEGEYRIEPSGSGDNNNRGMVLQRAVSRMQMFANNPAINQVELIRTVIEADDPRLVKRLLLNQGMQAAEQQEDQAQEISIMLLGFPAQVMPSDDDWSHLQSLVGFVRRRATVGEPMTAETLTLIAAHAQQHLDALKKKNQQMYQQRGPQIKAFIQEVQQQAQQMTAAQQHQQQQQQQPGNVVPMNAAGAPPAGAGNPAAMAAMGGAM